MKVIRRNVPELLDEIGFGQKKCLADLAEMTQAEETKLGWDHGIVISRETVAAQDIPFTTEFGVQFPVLGSTGGPKP